MMGRDEPEPDFAPLPDRQRARQMIEAVAVDDFAVERQRFRDRRRRGERGIDRGIFGVRQRGEQERDESDSGKFHGGELRGKLGGTVFFRQPQPPLDITFSECLRAGAGWTRALSRTIWRDRPAAPSARG
jgi:hypothetical protein